ncbi:MAG: hypothetical protein M1827_003583 [Pycnora praestabilis]|nr:MAG: hypothetical protein M1827_003583 [Pycnora praestabilis]
MAGMTSRADIGLISGVYQAVVGTVEELSQSSRTMTLVRDQFETNFFGPVNIVKAALPTLRAQRSGHIMILTGITGHLGTPGLGMYCASGWALEGFCDSLAYEIAPFNIKMTIVQPNMETNILTNKVTFAPSLPQYSAENNTAPLSRGILSNLLTRLESSKGTVSREISSILNNTEVVSLYPPLPRDFKASLVAETIHALTAIGGYDNPPARHIVGHEGVASVKEKLKTVSEELEDFVEVSGAVDIIKEEDGSPNVDGVMGSED